MRLLAQLVSVLAAAWLLAACGGSSESEEKAAAPQAAKTEDKAEGEAAAPPKEPRKEEAASVKGRESGSSSTNKNYGSREELAERFGLASNEEEAYRSNALLHVELSRQDIKRTQKGFIELQQAVESGRIPPRLAFKPSESQSGPPVDIEKVIARLKRDTRYDIEKLIETPVLFEDWDERVPARYERCHVLISQKYEKGLDAAEAFLDYTDDYERATLENGLNLSKDAEGLAYDAEECLGD